MRRKPAEEAAAYRGMSQKPGAQADVLVRVDQEGDPVAAEREHVAEEREELAAEMSGRPSG
jgi:hypothetical protein